MPIAATSGVTDLIAAAREAGYAFPAVSFSSTYAPRTWGRLAGQSLSLLSRQAV